MGSGRTETLRAIFGADPKESGQIFIHDREVTITSPEDAIKAGLVLVPEDRVRTACARDLVCGKILAFPNLDHR